MSGTHRRGCAAVSGFAILALGVGCATMPSDHLLVDGPKAQRFEKLGTYERTVTTSSAQAQEFFNQGLAWLHAFNHDEAIRSFARAAELDPGCAMAWWGIALAEGPNYNDPVMTKERTAAAWAALKQAQARMDNTTELERALIEALSTRYSKRYRKDRKKLEQDYADAMAVVWDRYPEDPDVGALYAEAMMVQRPWKLYSVDREPLGNTPEIVATLEKVMQLAPGHPGAAHLYIHAVEPSKDPGRAVEAADRLCDQVPGAGHLNHMPSHIYVQVGQWDKSVAQNAKAMAADDRYRKMSPDQGIQHMYMVHNAHMLAFSAMMIGREKEAMEAARAMWEDVPPEVIENVAPYLDRWMSSVYDVQKRFGRWDELLQEPAPPEYFPITRATWRAHRAVAYAAKQDFANARNEKREFIKAKAAIPPDNVFGRDLTHNVLKVSEYFIDGEIALQEGDWDRAEDFLKRAVEVEDTLSYGEPPQWLQPTRHTLGAVYLKAEKFAEAEQVYRKDLEKWQNNGWSLLGLSMALYAQGKNDEAEQVERQYQAAWAKADEPTDTSCKCIPAA